jgi:hypothetical protein
MGVPTSDVGYTYATARKGDHEVHQGHVVAWGGIYIFNPLTPELNPSAQTLPAEIFLLGILIFKGLTARVL